MVCYVLIGLLVGLASGSSVVFGSIQFGSQDSSIVLSSGALTISNATLTGGTVRTVGNLTVTGATTTCSGMKLVSGDVHGGRVFTDGTVTMGTSITLGNSQQVCVSGGVVREAITAAGTSQPALLEGFGSITQDTTIGDQARLLISWQSVLSGDVFLSPDTATHLATLELKGDLKFGVGAGVIYTGDATMTGRILFNDYRLFLGGSADVSTTITGSQTWDCANLWLSGPVLLDADTVLLFSSEGYINGNGSRCMFSSGAQLDNGGYGMVVEDIVFQGVTADSFAGSGDWSWLNVRFESGTSALMLNGSTVSSTIDLFGGNATFGASRLVLHTDLALGGTWTFGSTGAVTNEYSVLDLNGYALDLADASAALALQGGIDTTLRIANGRLLNVSGTKLSAEADTKIILENVEICLSDAGATTYTFADAALDVEGGCSISGLQGAVFSYTATDALTIARNGRLTVLDGLIYSHNNTGLTNFIMTDSSSRLELIGGTFRRPDSAATLPLVLTKGTIVLDHRATFQPGADGIKLGDGSDAANDVCIEVRPAASVVIATGTGASAGTLTYANVSG